MNKYIYLVPQFLYFFLLFNIYNLYCLFYWLKFYCTYILLLLYVLSYICLDIEVNRVSPRVRPLRPWPTIHTREWLSNVDNLIKYLFYNMCEFHTWCGGSYMWERCLIIYDIHYPNATCCEKEVSWDHLMRYFLQMWGQ